MNQYKNKIDERRNLILSAEAVYIDRIETDDVLVRALPPKRTVKELIQDCTVFPGLPPQSIFKNMSHEEKLSSIRKLNKARIYLPYYYTIEEAVDDALVSSYERRVSIRGQMGEYKYNGRDMPVHQFLEINELSDAPTGFCLIGRSGCGKTTGINHVLRKYPKVIIHNAGTMEQYIQIPVMAVHMSENNNFHGLYECIGKTLDTILQNTSRTYQNELGRKRDSLSAKFNKLCDLIRIFHIGMLIIDEIELINTSHTKEGTLETFMSLSNQTGIAVAVIGTEDAFGKLFRHARTTRRLGTLINADSYCYSQERIKNILSVLFTYLPKPCNFTNECFKAFYEESNGIIAYISQLFVGVAIEITKLQDKNKPSEITPSIIKKIAKKCFAGRNILNKYAKENRIIEDDEYALATVRTLLSNDEPLETPEIPQYDRVPSVRNIVKDAIHAFCGDKYPDETIESALHKIMTNVADGDIQTAISLTLAELKRRDDAKSNKKSKQKQTERAIVDLEALKATLPVTEDL